jgi:hypothetical protein
MGILADITAALKPVRFIGGARRLSDRMSGLGREFAHFIALSPGA